MDTGKLTEHIERTLAHTLFKHQYGIANDEKITSIVKTMVNYLQGLHDAHIIHDFSLSVLKVADDQVSVSIRLTQFTGSETFLVKSELHTRYESPHDSDFDRAMGVIQL